MLILMDLFVFNSINLVVQKNVDEAVEKLKARGIEVLGVVCHVSITQQRRNLIDRALQVRRQDDIFINFLYYYSYIVA